MLKSSIKDVVKTELKLKRPESGGLPGSSTKARGLRCQNESVSLLGLVDIDSARSIDTHEPQVEAWRSRGLLALRNSMIR